ncbi:hypothetical protein [Psychromonas antarctica]|jgi:hypothetical protein|uniref:hypothetical protein n=1 Tax=Psychromonas antarctica TaxID=67573 RepID=UPI001EE80EF1|nr:hypothetical protein [Psychromonas antarctica]MCG6202155.1 hypothetical protein [Psychromonas antarctica]
MNYSKGILSEVIKSTLLTFASFTLFDLFIQGYSNYHSFILSVFLALFSAYYFFFKDNATTVN